MKIAREQQMEIYLAAENGALHTDLAKQYGCTSQAISYHVRKIKRQIEGDDVTIKRGRKPKSTHQSTAPTEARIAAEVPAPDDVPTSLSAEPALLEEIEAVATQRSGDRGEHGPERSAINVPVETQEARAEAEIAPELPFGPPPVDSGEDLDAEAIPENAVATADTNEAVTEPAEDQADDEVDVEPVTEASTAEANAGDHQQEEPQEPETAIQEPEPVPAATTPAEEPFVPKAAAKSRSSSQITGYIIEMQDTDGNDGKLFYGNIDVALTQVKALMRQHLHSGNKMYFCLREATEQEIAELEAEAA